MQAAPRCAHSRKAYAEAAPRLQALRRYERQKKQAQQRALLELKQSTDTAYAQLCAANERRARKEQRQAISSDAMVKATLEHSGNPYVHIRMRRAAAHRERKEALLLAKRRDAEVRIANVLLREDKRVLRRATAARAAQRTRARRLQGLASPS